MFIFFSSVGTYLSFKSSSFRSESAILNALTWQDRCLPLCPMAICLASPTARCIPPDCCSKPMHSPPIRCHASNMDQTEVFVPSKLHPVVKVSNETEQISVLISSMKNTVIPSLRCLVGDAIGDMYFSSAGNRSSRLAYRISQQNHFTY